MLQVLSTAIRIFKRGIGLIGSQVLRIMRLSFFMCRLIISIQKNEHFIDETADIYRSIKTTTGWWKFGIAKHYGRLERYNKIRTD